VDYHRLNAVAEEAYRTDKTVYFHYQLREFLEELERQWPASTNLPPSMKVAQTAALFYERLEMVRRAKKHCVPSVSLRKVNTGKNSSSCLRFGDGRILADVMGPNENQRPGSHWRFQ